MGVVRKYFARQFQWRSFFLDCEESEDFFISCWQKNRSSLPLLLWRTFLFLFCLAIITASIVIPIQSDYGGYWVIYLTHWGLLANLVASGSGAAVSAYCYFRGPFDSTYGLPWFVKVYWISFNIAIPSALFITIFYWSLLSSFDSGDGVETNNFALSKTLDIFIHGINSLLMLLLLFSSKHEQRLMHLYHYIAFLFMYLIFSIIYYAVGGTNGLGNVWVYPMLDWSVPGPTVVAVILTLVLAIFIYVVAVALAAGRDALANWSKGETVLLNRV